MKKLLTFGLCALFAVVARATPHTYSFVPSDNDLGDLDHKDTYIWGVSDANLKYDVTHGYSITGVTITITGLYNWEVADTDNQLYINILGNPQSGLHIVQDNPNDTGDNKGTRSNYFAGNIATNYGVYYTGAATLVTTYHDGNNNNTPATFTYNLTSTQRSILQGYIQAVTANGDADFGLGFDPDCHFYNTGVCVTITTSQNSVPDGSATLGLLSLGMVAIAALRRSLRK